MERNIRKAKVAVIGGAGFIGSHLVNHLIDERECEVIVLDNLEAGKKEFIHPKAKFVWCDITHSESELRRIFTQYKIEYVFNYAASPYIPVSFERPMHVFDINARGALNVMNAAQDAGVIGILQVSSAEIYGDAPNHKIDESYPANPHSSYGASKLAIDILVQARWREAKTPAIAMRQFNCVGERETHPYVIPEIIKQLSKNSDFIYLGNNSFRDFQYAGDAVKMAVELLEKGQFGEVYNMGSEKGVQIYDLARMIAKIMYDEPITIHVDESRARPWEIWHLQSDNTKLFNTITYRPQVPLEESLRRVIQDYKEHGFCF
jgi:nucleoside-diphosphate-sugar epimerase